MDGVLLWADGLGLVPLVRQLQATPSLNAMCAGGKAAGG